ncbi:MAG: hypothetical protein IPN77_19150 [Sandaracinaceae bacterium]|nr:hypothetical protein [Sandaracinaceae bacterium]
MSSWFAVAAGGAALGSTESAKKKSRLAKGTMKSTTIQAGAPASRKRRSESQMPMARNGMAVAQSAA